MTSPNLPEPQTNETPKEGCLKITMALIIFIVAAFIITAVCIAIIGASFLVLMSGGVSETERTLWHIAFIACVPIGIILLIAIIILIFKKFNPKKQNNN